MSTIAALKRKGWHGLRIRCGPCNDIHILIWAYLRQADEIEVEALFTRLRCKTCGTRPAPADVTPYFLDTSRAVSEGAPFGDIDWSKR